eukprot:766114-Hanusia_phi.AAC.14
MEEGMSEESPDEVRVDVDPAVDVQGDRDMSEEDLALEQEAMLFLLRYAQAYGLEELLDVVDPFLLPPQPVSVLSLDDDPTIGFSDYYALPQTRAG